MSARDWTGTEIDRVYAAARAVGIRPESKTMRQIRREHNAYHPAARYQDDADRELTAALDAMGVPKR